MSSPVVGAVVMELNDADVRGILTDALCVGFLHQHEVTEITIDEENGEVRVVFHPRLEPESAKIAESFRPLAGFSPDHHDREGGE